MIFTRSVLTLLIGIIILLSKGRANFLKANDEQTCEDLCTNCNGRATFEDNVCQCYVIDDYQRGAECIGRIKRQASELGLDIVSCDLADSDADRAARCIVSPFRRFKTQGDVDLIAKYFMNGLGGLLGSSKSKTGEPSLGIKKSDSSSGTGDKTQSSDKLNSDSDLVGAANPLDSASPMSGQWTGVNPLLGAAATWLNPQTFFAIGNGMQGAGGYNFVGQPNPSSMSSSTNHDPEIDARSENIVGSSHQDAGNSVSIGTQESYSVYPAGAMMGMVPYSYFLGAPNSAQLQDGSQSLPVQPYVYTYNSMVGAQNSPIVGDGIGLSPYCNYPSPLTGMNNPQSTDPGAELESNVAKELSNESNQDPTLGIKKDINSQDKIDELETRSYEGEEPVVSSKQIHRNLKENTVNLEEVGDGARGVSNYNKKRKQSRFDSKVGGTRSESMIKNRNYEASDGFD